MSYRAADDEWLVQSFDDPLCDAPAYLDPLHPGEVSCRCQRKAGHPATVDHLGYMPVRWKAAEWKAASEVPVAECSYCGTRITYLGGHWTTDDGTTACTDTSAPYVPHKPEEADR